ncbi:MAG: SagB/ThcOx family dehydrogenase [Planctomycetota bacterium]|jgi:SagB-type dehydrogenase family enzyme
MSNAIGRQFVERTKFGHLAASAQQRGQPQPPLEKPFAGEKTVELPNPASLRPEPADLKTLIDQRTSVRQYAPAAITLDQLSYLLWCTQGVREVIDRRATFRTVPSAGARHALETYLLINRAGQLPAGLYRYLALNHKLGEVSLGEHHAAEVQRGCLGQEMVSHSAVTFIWSAVAERMTWRYGERGFRYLYLDAGHVCQNLYLAAESIGCGVCAIAAFDDDEMNRVLSLDGQKEFVIYIATAGTKPS